MLQAISSSAVALVQARLSDPAAGLNQGIVDNAPNYGIPPFMEIDFGPRSNNFFLAQIDDDSMEQTGIFRYPYVCLYTLESGNTNVNKFTQFSGPVRVVMDAYISWSQTRPPQNMDAWAHCLEDVVYDVINRQSNQDWGSVVTYNGEIRSRRGPVRFAAQSLRQQVGFAINFSINTKSR